MRRFSTLIAVLALLSIAAAPASAFDWSLGANLGFQSLDVDGLSDNVNSFSWPSGGVLDLGSFQPGLRIGFTGSNPMHEVYLDTGLMIISTGDFTFRSFATNANYQWNMPSAGSANFYLTGGAGFSLIGLDSGGSKVSATSAVFGGGLGVRHRMGNGHGTLRAEVRYDHYTEGKDGSMVIVPETNGIGVKLGFDLWD